MIDKIKKLLELANSSNEHEASAAAQKAQALLIKHNLTMSEVEKSKDENEFVREDSTEKVKRRSKESFYINPLIQKFFFVQIVSVFGMRNQSELRYGNGRGGRRDKHEVYLGRKSNVEIAKYVSSFLNHSFKELWLEYKEKTGAPVQAKDSFYEGMAAGLREQLRANQEKVTTEMGLVIVPDAGLEQFKRSQFRGLTTESRRANALDPHAAQAGAEQGRKLKINKGLGAAATYSGRLLK